MSISLIHPSRGRPQKAAATCMNWLDKSSGDSEIEYILSLDTDDPELDGYRLWAKDHLFVNSNNSVVQATNRAAEKAAGDILIYLSDDFDCPNDWDKLIIAEFAKYTGPTLIKVDDCLQQFYVGVCTIPMMNRQLFDRLGYFWFPEYFSMHVDVDLYETCKRLGALKFAPHLKFPHNHYSNGKAIHDETYKRSEGNWNQGLQVINRRRAQGFPA